MYMFPCVGADAVRGWRELNDGEVVLVVLSRKVRGDGGRAKV